MRTTRLLPLALAAALSTVAGCATPATAPQAVAATDLAALDVALAGDWRTDANIARDPGTTAGCLPIIADIAQIWREAAMRTTATVA